MLQTLHDFVFQVYRESQNGGGQILKKKKIAGSTNSETFETQPIFNNEEQENSISRKSDEKRIFGSRCAFEKWDIMIYYSVLTDKNYLMLY